MQPDALFVIVPALALPTKLAAAAYILMFVLGTVAAMGAYTGAIGECAPLLRCRCAGPARASRGEAAAAWLEHATATARRPRPWTPPLTPPLTLPCRHRPLLCAGATSAAIKKSNSGLTQKLSGFASFAALALGATMLLGGLGIELPFSLPALPFFGGHAH